MDQCRRTLEQHNWNIEVRGCICVNVLVGFQRFSSYAEMCVCVYIYFRLQYKTD